MPEGLLWQRGAIQAMAEPRFHVVAVDLVYPDVEVERRILAEIGANLEGFPCRRTPGRASPSLLRRNLPTLPLGKAVWGHLPPPYDCHGPGEPEVVPRGQNPERPPDWL